MDLHIAIEESVDLTAMIKGGQKGTAEYDELHEHFFHELDLMYSEILHAIQLSVVCLIFPATQLSKMLFERFSGRVGASSWSILTFFELFQFVMVITWLIEF